MDGMIFDIQRFSTHDGAGIRTIVFFKGCPLHCSWCENPESQASYPEMIFDPRHCIGCLSCLQPGTGGLMRQDSSGRVVPVRPAKAAGSAGSLVEAAVLAETGGASAAVNSASQDQPALDAAAASCPSLAIRISGRKLSAKEIYAEVLKDEIFFRTSGGGVTFSGGEPLLQADLLLELVETFSGAGLDCAIETCLAVNPSVLEPFLDLPLTWLADLKHTDPQVFREATGGNLDLVKTNLERLAERGAGMVFRVPVIPGFNDSDQAMHGILAYAARLSGMNGKGLAGPGGNQGAGKDPARDAARGRLDLLPYHDFAAGKYAALGRPYPYAQGLGIPADVLERFAEAGRTLGLEVTIGG